MSDETIFTPAPTNDGGEAPKPTITLPDSVKDLVGEGKKYATVEKALEALAHSQVHISKIEQENAELREKTTKAKTTEEVYETVQELLKSREATPQVTALDEGKVAELLDRHLTAKAERDRREANVGAVRKALAEKFGEKAEEVYRNRASELGIGLETMNALAGTSANAVLEYFGIKKEAGTVPTRPKSSLNTDALDGLSTPSAPPKTVMGGSTTKEVNAAWAAAKQRVLDQFK